MEAAADPGLSPGSRTFEDLVLPLMPAAYQLARLTLRDPSAAEDAVQEATTRAWRRYEALRDRDRVRAWYFSIVINVCRSIRRSRWWSVRTAEELEVVATPLSDGDILNLLELRRAFRQLTARDRAVLALHLHFDVPLQEVAQTLGISESAAKARFYRALRHLRAAYEESNDE